MFIVVSGRKREWRGGGVGAAAGERLARQMVGVSKVGGGECAAIAVYLACFSYPKESLLLFSEFRFWHVFLLTSSFFLLAGNFSITAFYKLPFPLARGAGMFISVTVRGGVVGAGQKKSQENFLLRGTSLGMDGGSEVEGSEETSWRWSEGGGAFVSGRGSVGGGVLGWG